MSTESEELLLVENTQPNVRKRVSIVWQYFEKLNRCRVRCKLCRHEQNYQGTTGNILRHLLKKHNIDATVKGQIENPEAIRRLREQLAEMDEEKRSAEGEYEDEYEVVVKTEYNQVNILTVPRQQRESRGKVVSYCEETEVDPYADSAIQYDEYITTNPTTETTQKNTKEAKSNTIQEDRILAEIEYFREKAAYYRMQKNLTALQAKKIKYELDQLV